MRKKNKKCKILSARETKINEKKKYNKKFKNLLHSR